MPVRGEQQQDRRTGDGSRRPGLRPAGAILAVAGAVWWRAAAGVVVSGVLSTVVWVAAGVHALIGPAVAVVLWGAGVLAVARERTGRRPEVAA